MTNTFNIAFMADTHLGYSAYPYTNGDGINLRVRDGEMALHEMVNQIIDSPEPIDAVLHGGDIFHSSKPEPRDIFMFRYYATQLLKAGIPFYGLAGNHDASDDRSKMPSVAAVDDPEHGIHALWKPYQKYLLNDGIALHSVAHHGLTGDQAPIIKPDSDMVNLFTTHGAALDPKNATLMSCSGPREQIIPPEMIIDDNFAIRLLGHYHSRYPVGGKLLNTWYAGSTVRRGFSDETGDRGWLLVKVHPDGRTEIEPRNIFQRPQYDLKLIDAQGMSASDVQERIMNNITSTNPDGQAEAFDEVNAPIVRQRVINAPRSLKVGIDKRQISALTGHMLNWQLKITAPEILDNDNPAVDEKGKPTLARISSGSNDTVDFFNTWVGASKTLSTIPDSQRNVITLKARKHLESVQAQRKNKD